ncbi:family 78 glycoside hydrolase catalytic domain [Vibrio mangrovi]|uniref:alpha-L-rhamnosidase n=1 Tax=Vibrio mangrovi TaxID=474394 RepID=A0A1Y6IVH7_9VIBR|nr:family 78 glycoside hydrolase catalytic domain [Vibrio mangrovi]MDW6003159.1 family 78 glycoside hydrolase catalytic domain [Vibrio mangrovi]SMS00053.1 Bacterial alpha-L-rhamnosidase [Vibrio mangrovi]
MLNSQQQMVTLLNKYNRELVMSDSELKINDSGRSIVVDQTPINVSWYANFKQCRYVVYVIKDGQVVFSKDNSGSDNSCIISDIQLEKSTEYVTEVHLYGDSGEEQKLVNSFVTGNFGEFEGCWISNGKALQDEVDFYQESRNTVIRKKIYIADEINKAYIHLVGLGYYNLYINGEKVSRYELNNDWTNYDKTIFYDTFDIQPFLKPGENDLFVELGNGWYNPAPLTLFGKYNLRNVLTIGEPKLLADIVIQTGTEWETIPTDESWLVAEGPYLFNNIYLGEVLDFRLHKHESDMIDFHDTSWTNAMKVEGPKGVLKPSYIEKVTQNRVVKPVEVIPAEDGKIVVDFGEVISGFIDISFMGHENQVIDFLYSEEINEDKTLNTASTLAGFVGKQVADDFTVPGGAGAPELAEQRDRCICRDGTLRFTNKFTYHSFRYVELKGIDIEHIQELEAICVHTELNPVGYFRCSDSFLNELHDVAKNTKLNNIHAVFEDCARERLAYGGDMVALATSQVFMFNTAKLYEKTIGDFINDMRPNGGMPETAPFMGIKTNGTGDGAGPLGWQLVVPYLLKIHYQYYGNLELIRNVYPFLEKQIEHLSSLDPELICDFCLGDWGSKDANPKNFKKSSPAINFTATCFHYFHFLLISDFSKKLGLNDKWLAYSQKADSLKQEIINRYRNDDGSYADRTQTSYIFAIYFALEDEPGYLIDALVNLIESNNFEITSGIFGQSFAYELFRKYDLNHILYQWLYHEDGIRHMLRDNNLALKEFFGENKNGSCNHAMFSSYASWFYKGLGGIEICDDSCGSDIINIKPYFDTSIDFVDCSYETPQGVVTCNWSRNNELIELYIKVPFNLKRCMLIIDRAYEDSVRHMNVVHVEKKHVYVDIIDTGELNIKLNTVVLPQEEMIDVR